MSHRTTALLARLTRGFGFVLLRSGDLIAVQHALRKKTVRHEL